MPPRLRTLPRFSPSTSTAASTAIATATFTFPTPPLSNRRHARISAAKNFSTTAGLYTAGREPTYYEILNVPVTATAAEIKKYVLYIQYIQPLFILLTIFLCRQFYALSLAHHPDRNRDDPTASARFARISSAYQVLGNSAARARYDRDNGIVNQNTSGGASAGQHQHQHPTGSHSSYGSYAGSRPASGLSKRRGPFRGPPPSFYTHGGYGARGTRPGQTTASASAAAAGSTTGKTEEDPTSFIKHNPVGHFNAQGHYRTQAAEDARRQQRKMRELGLADRDVGSETGGLMLRFLIVCGILAGAGAVAGLFQTPGSRASSSSRKRDER